MTSRASKNRSWKASAAALGAAAAFAAAALSETPTGAVGRGSGPVPAYHFPSPVLKTHEGKNVRFYEDLIQGKVVLLNFMYADCKRR